MRQCITILAGIVAMTLLADPSLAQPPAITSGQKPVVLLPNQRPTGADQLKPSGSSYLAAAQPQGRQGDGREARGQRQGQGLRRKPGGRGGQGGSRNPVLLALDADGDGELSASEIANVVAALKTLDANRDGKLSRDELRPADRGQGQGGDFNRPPRPGESRDRENRRPDGGSAEWCEIKAFPGKWRAGKLILGKMPPCSKLWFC